jgi:hypothetical protein
MKDLLSCATSLSCEEVKLLDEETVHKCLNNDEDTPVLLKISYSEIVNMKVKMR